MRRATPGYTFSYPRFRYFQEHLRPEADLAAYDDETVTLSLHGEPVRLEGGRVSANFFPLLGVKPAIGRFFQPGEDRHGAEAVVVLGNRLWKERYGADPAILGRAIRIDDEEFTVIGVLPAGFQFLGVPVDVWRSRIVDTRTFAPTSVQFGRELFNDRSYTSSGRYAGAASGEIERDARSICSRQLREQ